MLKISPQLGRDAGSTPAWGVGPVAQPGSEHLFIEVTLLSGEEIRGSRVQVPSGPKKS